MSAGRGLDFTLNDITHNVLSGHNHSTQVDKTPKLQVNKENDGEKRSTGEDKRSMGGASSAELGRWLEEKERVVVRQKEEIAVLRKFIEDISHNREYRDQEEELKRQQEMLRLRQQESSYLHNLRELDGLKASLGRIKKKYEALLNEKNAMSLRNSALLSENEELTIRIADLKQSQGM